LLLRRNRGKYEVIAKSVVTEAVRRLEMFLLEDCKLPIQKLSIEELSGIFDVLLQCRQKMLT
jgi:hypothetical protein